MGVVRAMAGWIGRRAMLFLLLVGALALHQVATRSKLSYDDLRRTVARLEAGAQALPAFTASAIDRGNRSVAAAQGLSKVALDARIAEATAARDGQGKACRSDLSALLRGGAEQVMANRRACIVASLVDREIVALRVLRDTVDIRRSGESLGGAVRRQTGEMRRAALANRDAVARGRALRAEVLGGLRHAGDLRRLDATAATSAGAYRAAKSRAALLVASKARLDRATMRTQEALEAVQASLDRLVAGTRRDLAGNGIEQLQGWAEWAGLDRLLRTAALAFVGILATPYLIRVLFYWLLAPLAARRPAIRLSVEGAAIPPAARSATSVGITLGVGEELLVRQDYLQTTAVAGERRTRWLLDWRHPLTSLAAGLFFLARIRGEGTLTTVSAVHDAFAEVTVVTLPAGGACVLQPRALAAVVQPIGAPLRITRHWRLGSLHAWLTLQLRYLEFHGPARLVIKGGRGVRVEPAQAGRVFGQDQLVGFSAELAYSVTRTELFWPYLFGREPLFRDRVADGDGVLIVEEAPMAGRRGGIGRGLEGAMDAALKVFGV